MDVQTVESVLFVAFLAALRKPLYIVLPFEHDTCSCHKKSTHSSMCTLSVTKRINLDLGVLLNSMCRKLLVE